jgi:hypothetical protein
MIVESQETLRLIFAVPGGCSELTSTTWPCSLCICATVASILSRRRSKEAPARVGYQSERLMGTTSARNQEKAKHRGTA